jgi:hypothetical protein
LDKEKKGSHDLSIGNYVVSRKIFVERIFSQQNTSRIELDEALIIIT